MSESAYTITSRELQEALAMAVATRLPIFLWGPPGIGKSQGIASFAHRRKSPIIDLRMAQTEPTDIRGIPYYNKETNKMEWAHPIELPTQEFASQYESVFLFLDELNTAPPAVQAAAYQLVLDRRVGTYVLPDNVYIIAAGNRETDRGVTYKMPSPLANRFVHLEMRPDAESFIEWAQDEGDIHADVVGYISFAKHHLFEHNPNSASKGFPTPRTWHYVSNVLKKYPADSFLVNAFIAGAIGDGVAAGFIQQRKYASKLPTGEQILSGAVTEIPKDIELSSMYILSVNLANAIRDSSKNDQYEDFVTKSGNLLSFITDNFTPEMVTHVIKMTTVQNKVQLPITRLKQFPELLKKNKEFFTTSDA